METVYDDLIPFDLGDCVERLQEENAQLKKHITSLELDIKKLMDNIMEMKHVQNNLSVNISELYKTAKVEIERKDKKIAELQKELDKYIYNKKYRSFNNQQNEVTEQESTTSKAVVETNKFEQAPVEFDENRGNRSNSYEADQHWHENHTHRRPPYYRGYPPRGRFRNEHFRYKMNRDEYFKHTTKYYNDPWHHHEYPQNNNYRNNHFEPKRYQPNERNFKSVRTYGEYKQQKGRESSTDSISDISTKILQDSLEDGEISSAQSHEPNPKDLKIVENIKSMDQTDYERKNEDASSHTPDKKPQTAKKKIGKTLEQYRTERKQHLNEKTADVPTNDLAKPESPKIMILENRLICPEENLSSNTAGKNLTKPENIHKKQETEKIKKEPRNGWRNPKVILEKFDKTKSEKSQIHRTPIAAKTTTTKRVLRSMVKSTKRKINYSDTTEDVDNFNESLNDEKDAKVKKKSKRLSRTDRHEPGDLDDQIDSSPELTSGINFDSNPDNQPNDDVTHNGLNYELHIEETESPSKPLELQDCLHMPSFETDSVRLANNSSPKEVVNTNKSPVSSTPKPKRRRCVMMVLDE